MFLDTSGCMPLSQDGSVAQSFIRGGSGSPDHSRKKGGKHDAVSQ